MDKRRIGDRTRDLCLLGGVRRNKSMEAITSLGILFVVVFIVYFLIREFRNEISSKGKRQITQEEYGEIKQKWNKKQIENLEEAIKMYPSKHLMNNNEEWEKMVERQRDYAAKKDVLYANQLQG